MTCNVLMGTLNPAHSLTHSQSVADTEILRICVRKRTSPQSAHIRRGQYTPTRTREQGHTQTHTYRQTHRQTHRQTDTETGR